MGVDVFPYTGRERPSCDLIRKDGITMKQLLKERILPYTGALFLFLLMMIPSVAGAEGENPVTKLKDKLKFNWAVIDNLDFGFTLFMIVISLFIVACFCLIIFFVVTHVMKSLRGKAEIGDKRFWIKISVSALILFLFTGGAVMGILEKIYTWQSNLKIGQ
jgi:hypothetical protein